MKKPFIIATVAVAALLLCTAAQSCRQVSKIISGVQKLKKVADDNTKYLHLEFLDIPIAGGCNKFVDTLKALGFHDAESYSDAYWLYGNYSGLPVEACVYFTPITNLVSRVAVYYPDRSSWADIESEYFRLKDSLTVLYGEPESKEVFEPPFKKGDGYEHKAVEKKMCEYWSVFSVYHGSALVGTIYLDLGEGDDPDTFEIMLLFTDAHNYQMEQKETAAVSKMVDSVQDSQDDTDSTEASTAKDSTSTQPTESNNKPIQ